MESDARARFRRMYEEHYEPVLAYALRRVDRAPAEDVVAETFLVAWRRFHDLPAEPLPWLLGTARRVISNHRRSAGRRDAMLSRLGSTHPRSVDDHADGVTTRSQVLDAFRTLSPKDREVLGLVAWDGLSADQAADSLGCSVGAFWVRLHRARRRLAGALGEPPASGEVIDIDVERDRT